VPASTLLPRSVDSFRRDATRAPVQGEMARAWQAAHEWDVERLKKLALVLVEVQRRVRAARRRRHRGLLSPKSVMSGGALRSVDSWRAASDWGGVSPAHEREHTHHRPGHA
jgi:hypothetical protein